MKGPPCLMCSANTMFIKTKRDICRFSSFECFLLKVLVFFMLLPNSQGGLLQLHGSHLPTSLIPGRAVLTKYDFKFLLFLKSIIGTSGNTFLWSLSRARTTCKLTFHMSKHWVIRNIKCQFAIFSLDLFIIKQFISWNLSYPKYFLLHQFRTVSSFKNHSKPLHRLSKQLASEQMRFNFKA